MPNAYVQKLAKKGKHSEDELERRWSKAKKLAADKGESDNYAYITGIFKRMVGEALTFAEYNAILVTEEGAPVTSVGGGGVDAPEGKKLTKKPARRKKKKKDELEESYFVKRTVGDKVRYWDGKKWNMDNAKGYKSEKLALNTARNIVSKVLAFSDEITIENSNE